MKKLLFILILISLSRLNAQSLEEFKKIGPHKFSLNDKVGKLHEFRDEFKSNPELFHDFKRFNASRKAQKTINYIGFSLGGLSLIGGVILDESFEGSEVDGLGLALGIVGAGFGAAFAGLGNLFAGIPKITYKNRLLKKMNIPTTSFQESEKSLKLKNTHNGIGLVYNF